jgi:MFS family permease
MSIFPYVYYMVSSFHVTGDDRKIALYAGAVTSSFTLAEFSTGLFWGRMSDKVGRKPILITGLVGTAISMIVFGFAPSLPVAMMARALGGLLNGNIGVLQTTVAELVTEKKHQPRAYSIMPFVWCLGSIIGPALGGTLAQPCHNYPWLFPRGTLFDRFPFLLPNLMCVVVLCFGIVVGILFLEETHAEKKFNRDVGLEMGQWVIGKFTKSSSDEREERKISDACLDDSHSLFGPPQPPGYQSTEDHPRISSMNVPVLSTYGNTNRHHSGRHNRAFTKGFTPQVISVIVGYGILA